MQNTHDLLVGTLSIGIPSLFLCNQSLGVLPGASNRNCGYFARTPPQRGVSQHILNFLQAVYIATQSQGNLHISESIFFIGFLQDSEIIVKVMGQSLVEVNNVGGRGIFRTWRCPCARYTQRQREEEGDPACCGNTGRIDPHTRTRYKGKKSSLISLYFSFFFFILL